MSASAPAVLEQPAAVTPAADDGPAKAGSTATVWIARLVLAVVLLGVWELLSRAEVLDPLFFGRPTGIIDYFWTVVVAERTIYADLGWTVAATLLAFGLGSLAAVGVGLVFAAYPIVERIVQPGLTGLNALPRVALAPLFLIWFGLGITSKVALGFSLTFFIVLASTVAGIRSVDPDLQTLTRTLGAGAGQTFRRVTLPSAVPVIFAGLRLGLIYALLGVVASELIAAEHGLGQQLSYLANTYVTDGVFAVLLLLALIGGGISGLMSWMEARLLRWR